MLGISDKHHGCLCTQGLDTTGKRLIGHIVLHNIYQRLIHTLVLASEFIKSDSIPITNQSDLAIGVIDE